MNMFMNMVMDMNKMGTLPTVLIVILIVGIIFCYLSNYYSGMTLNDFLYNETLNDKLYLLELMNEARVNSIKQLKENFGTDDLLLTTTAMSYNSDLDNLENSLNNNVYGENGMLEDIRVKILNLKDVRNQDKEALLKLLTNVFILKYIIYNNKLNGASYQEFLKYRKPENNKYYKQYL